ncbi:MAG: DUF2945 domain-containing protein [Burkholderiales bacterium]
MANEFKEGDKVKWHTTFGATKGEVIEKITEPTQIKGHVAKASEKQPQYIVQSDKTLAKAAHKPEALTKISS